MSRRWQTISFADHALGSGRRESAASSRPRIAAASSSAARASRARPAGDLLPGTPFAVRLVQYLLGLGIVALLASIASWVAFGGGSRHFTGSGPFISGAVNEALGRTAFGIGAALAWAFMALMIVVSVKRLRRRSLRRVDLLQLTRRPLHGVLRAHALDRLREHVDDDVLAQRFGRLAPRRPRVAHLPRVR